MLMRPLKHKYILRSSACFLLSVSLVLLVSLFSFLLVSFDRDIKDHGLVINVNNSKGSELVLHHDQLIDSSRKEIKERWEDEGQGPRGAGWAEAEAAAAHDDKYCDGRRIYMYDLPEEFNALIVQQCHSKIVGWLNFCPHVLNHGFGRRAAAWTSWADWYETDPYMLEVIFHSRMAYSYPCTTHLPHHADAFFIPYYSGLDALHYLYGERKRKREQHGLRLVRWLMENVDGGEHWRRRGGHDHFIVMGRTAWDLTRMPTPSLVEADAEEGWGTSFASLPAMKNVTALFVERRPWQTLEQAIPYPTGFHPTSLQSLRAWQHKVRVANRTFLMAFVGAPRPLESCSSEVHRKIRQAAIDQCTANGTACSLLDCSKWKCAHDSVGIAERLLDAHFCLQPPGDTATRRSTFDGLLSGCIPVFFMNDSAYNQYTWHLPGPHPSSYSVFVPDHQLHRVLPLLASFSVERIEAMRSFIVEQLMTGIIYASPQLARSHPSLRDAFQLTLDNMLRRVAQNT